MTIYILKELSSGNMETTFQKTKVADILGVHRNTVGNKLKQSNPFIHGGYEVFEAFHHISNVSSGNRTPKSMRG